MNANPNIAARDQLRAAIAARTEAECVTAEAKAAVERAQQFLAELETDLKAIDDAAASAVRDAMQNGNADAPMVFARDNLVFKIDVAKKFLAQLQAEHAAASGRHYNAEHGVAQCARAVMNAEAESFVIELESMQARKSQIQTMLHGLAECGGRLPSETASGPFPLGPRAISALCPPSQDYLDRHTVNPLAPRIEASAKWRQFFSALVENADAQFEA